MAGSFVRALRFWATHSPAAGEAARAYEGDGFKLSDKVRLLGLVCSTLSTVTLILSWHRMTRSSGKRNYWGATHLSEL